VLINLVRCSNDCLTEDIFVSETQSLVRINSASKYVLGRDVITLEFAVLLYILLAFKAVVSAQLLCEMYERFVRVHHVAVCPATLMYCNEPRYLDCISNII